MIWKVLGSTTSMVPSMTFGHGRGVDVLLCILLLRRLLGSVLFLHLLILAGLLRLLKVRLIVGGLPLLLRLTGKLGEQIVPVGEQATLERRVHQNKTSNEQRHTEDEDQTPSPPLPAFLRLRLSSGSPRGLLVPIGVPAGELFADALPFRPVALLFLFLALKLLHQAGPTPSSTQDFAFPATSLGSLLLTWFGSSFSRLATKHRSPPQVLPSPDLPRNQLPPWSGTLVSQRIHPYCNRDIAYLTSVRMATTKERAKLHTACLGKRPTTSCVLCS
jgi:hypothetical protein